ncbi:ethanolamine ammonia-lyase subunit EutC [Carnimonas bestiolae]|uniref:ethanolamine ammonia-lyase subunit EutC n=1 Tax=Carnimonas bestiolae TaxID=3402172 RepID=UPI003EDBF6D1
MTTPAPADESSGEKAHSVVLNSWRNLRDYTDARIGLGRSGNSLPTQAMLAFQLDHAQARDAVHLALDTETMMAGLAQRFPLALRLHSQAQSRSEYLRRPDYGRLLDAPSTQQLAALNNQHCDISLSIVDGLSARAIHEQALPFVDALLPHIERASLSLGPVALVEQGRVAIGDPIGEALKARMSIVLIGERPGLSSPDSLGIYFTWQPRSGCLDSARNCISNVRPRGQSFTCAAQRLAYLINGALEIRASGIALKDNSEANAAPLLGDGGRV